MGFLAAACSTPRSINLPTDAGTPMTDFAAAHQEVSRACTGVRTMTAELALSGRAGSERLRGRVIAGFERPASMRLEGTAPFGAPAFILASRADASVLLLPRDSRVVRGARPEEILGALTGVTLGPADLLAVLTGCVTPGAKPLGGAQHQGDWATLALSGGATMYLRRSGGAWVLVAARRDGWRIDYTASEGTFPRRVRLRRESGGAQEQPSVDLTAELSAIETNIEIAPEAFTVVEQPGMQPLTLDELREAGPLRGDQR